MLFLRREKGNGKYKKDRKRLKKRLILKNTYFFGKTRQNASNGCKNIG